MLWSLALFTFVFASAQGRAVNISNTWVLPEEGFPVFYRYFRDRISWYEADAVCQFHHANLVTVDTTAQYDAVRAYLKELDISSAVWVGLIRSNPDGDFTWTFDILPTERTYISGEMTYNSDRVPRLPFRELKDYRGLSGDGYWSSAPDPRSAPLCAAADPAADYRWEARACGGPTVASFICELPVPQWALGNEGCMVRELPALTVLYLPESAAVQLTADCGLAGVKKVQCTGNLKRENLLRDLSCADEDEQSSTPNTGATTSTSSSMSSSDNLLTDQDTINDVTTEDNITTEHEDDINQSTTVKPTAAPYNIRPSLSEQAAKQILNNVNKILISKNLDLDDNMQSNDIPKLVGYDNFLSSDLSDKIEDETHKQHKILHDEIARHGNFETIFTQPTDHFVPPLVMAKAKISDDMTVLSLEEKHAQQLAEQHYAKHVHDDNFASDKRVFASSSTKDESNGEKNADRPLITTTFPTTLNPEIKKDVLKNIAPKKYNDKYYGLKSKSLKLMGIKSTMNEKLVETSSTSSHSHLDELDTTSPKYFIEDTYKSENEPTIDLTVVIKEPYVNEHQNNSSDTASDIPNIMIIQNDTSITKPEIKLGNPEINNGEVTQEISVKLPTPSIDNFTMTHEIIKITILKEENLSDALTMLEVTTKLPVFDESNLQTTITPSVQDFTYENINNTSTQNYTTIKTVSSEKTENHTDVTPHSESISTIIKSETIQKEIDDTTTTHTEPTPTTNVSSFGTTESNDNMTEKHNSNVTELPEILSTETEYSKTDLQEEGVSSETNITDTSETIDDFQSPLLSGANEPVHRPNRSRRPQPANRNKFNPFRILG